MEQLPVIIGALVSVITAVGSVELLRRGRAKAAEDRAKAAEADAFRYLLLLRRFAMWVAGRDTSDDPVLTEIAADAERETTT